MERMANLSFAWGNEKMREYAEMLKVALLPPYQLLRYYIYSHYAISVVVT